ncbi:hypothetical protein BD779DRAFT_509207 [Infundibulicybe gibba]|nr:hypothetical protein BD779DRAFT_509207 [Infundibulicybe gibba]
MTLTFLDTATLGVIVEGMLYGVYMVLFILYLVLRRRNNRVVVDGPLTMAQILLFVLCTSSLCLDIAGTYLELLVLEMSGTITTNKLDIASQAIFTFIDYLAQMILLYRCWIIWDKRYGVVAVPGFLALVTLGGGFALVGLVNSPLWNTEGIDRLYRPIGIMTYSASLSVNALTTLLIVTKISLTSREVRTVLNFNPHKSFRIVTAMLIESGLLTLTFQLVFVILFAARITAFNITSTMAAQIYGITPTLLNIRVVMGTAFDKATEKTRSLRFAHSEGPATTRTTGPSISAAGVQSWGISAELGGASNNERTADP